MGFTTSLANATNFMREFRSSLENPSAPLSYPQEWLLDLFNGGRTDSGLRVSEFTALQVTTVYACVNLIASTIGSLPLHVYERTFAKDKRPSKSIAFDHDLYDMLQNEPNDEMSAYTWRKTSQAHASLWGNGYTEIQRDNGNRPVAVWPRNPARTRAVRLAQSYASKDGKLPAGTLVYETTEGMEESDPNPSNPEKELRQQRIILKEDMIHVPGLTLDGRIGQGTIYLARQAVGLALATEKYGAKFFSNGARPAGILSYPGKLNPPARENLRRSWKEAFGGENVHSLAVVEEAMKFEKIASDADVSQFLETRQFQKSEICSMFGVPPHMIGETEKSNRANTEELGLAFVTFCLQPWLEAWQQELKRKLFPRAGRSAGKFFAMYETRRLIFPDAASRTALYSSGHQNSYLSTNDLRDLEGFNPIDEPWADECWVQINMQLARTAAAEPAQGPGPADPTAEADPNEATKDDQPDKLGQRFVKVYFRLFKDAFGRITARSTADQDAFRRAFLPVFSTIADQIYRVCAREMRSDTPAPDFAASPFIVDVIDGMQKRFDQWKQANGDADPVAERELSRAVKAICHEVYRALATERAKVLTEA